MCSVDSVPEHISLYVCAYVYSITAAASRNFNSNKTNNSDGTIEVLASVINMICLNNAHLISIVLKNGSSF